MVEHADHVEHDTSAQEFRIQLGEQTAMLQYRANAMGVNFFYTEVPVAHRRQGIAQQLAHAGLEFAKQNELRVSASCGFVADYIRRHPEYHALVDEFL